MDLRRDVEKRLRLLKSKLTRARKDIAWDFGAIKSNKSRLTPLRRRLVSELAADLETIVSVGIRSNGR